MNAIETCSLQTYPKCALHPHSNFGISSKIVTVILQKNVEIDGNAIDRFINFRRQLKKLKQRPKNCEEFSAGKNIKHLNREERKLVDFEFVV